MDFSNRKKVRLSTVRKMGFESEEYWGDEKMERLKKRGSLKKQNKKASRKKQKQIVKYIQKKRNKKQEYNGIKLKNFMDEQLKLYLNTFGGCLR